MATKDTTKIIIALAILAVGLFFFLRGTEGAKNIVMSTFNCDEVTKVCSELNPKTLSTVVVTGGGTTDLVTHISFAVNAQMLPNPNQTLTNFTIRSSAETPGTINTVPGSFNAGTAAFYTMLKNNQSAPTVGLDTVASGPNNGNSVWGANELYTWDTKKCEGPTCVSGGCNNNNALCDNQEVCMNVASTWKCLLPVNTLENDGTIAFQAAINGTYDPAGPVTLANLVQSGTIQFTVTGDPTAQGTFVVNVTEAF